jgi:hypothetical protein
MTQELNSRGKVRVYACGGCGVNIGSMLEKWRPDPSPTIAQLDIAYIDTSRSNLKHVNAPADRIYLFDGLDGSGQIRKENVKDISVKVADILETFEPQDLSIVLHSACGGSGSVIGPSIVSALLEAKKSVVVLMVGSADTRLDALNTMNTLKSYDSIAKMRGLPVVLSYQQNSRENKRDSVDDQMVGTAVSLAILWSGNNRELDSKDLHNFVNYHIPTTFEPQVAHLTLLQPDGSLSEEVGQVISVATLAKRGQDTALDPAPEVQYRGFLADDAPDRLQAAMPTHFFVTDGILDEVNSMLKTTLKQHEVQQQSRTTKEGFLTDADKPTHSGLVL